MLFHHDYIQVHGILRYIIHRARPGPLLIPDKWQVEL